MPIHSEMRDQFPPTGPTSARVLASSGPADQEECTMVFVGLLLGRFGQLWCLSALRRASYARTARRSWGRRQVPVAFAMQRWLRTDDPLPVGCKIASVACLESGV